MIAAGLLDFALIPITLARPTYDRRDMVVRRELSGPPSGFVAGDTAPSGEIRLTLVMPQNNITGLHAALLDLSNPSSANYRRHLSKAEVRAYQLPSYSADC